MRHFIFFYKCANGVSFQYGQHGRKGNVIPSFASVTESIASNNTYSKSNVNILGFNEVSGSDYDNWFDNQTKANDSE